MFFGTNRLPFFGFKKFVSFFLAMKMIKVERVVSFDDQLRIIILEMRANILELWL